MCARATRVRIVDEGRMRTLGAIAAPSAFVVFVGCIGCNGRRSELEAYKNEICQCKDAACLDATQAKYLSTLERPPTWFEKKFTSRDAHFAMTTLMEQARTCMDKIRPPAPLCAGEGGLECPEGMICVDVDPNPDGMGHCVKPAKEGEPCIVPGDPCAKGLFCDVTQMGDPFSSGTCAKGELGLQLGSKSKGASAPSASSSK